MRQYSRFMATQSARNKCSHVCCVVFTAIDLLSDPALTFIDVPNSTEGVVCSSPFYTFCGPPRLIRHFDIFAPKIATQHAAVSTQREGAGRFQSSFRPEFDKSRQSDRGYFGVGTMITRHAIPALLEQVFRHREVSWGEI